MSKELIVYDRSRVTCDWGCPRRRFLQYEYNGKGLVPEHESYAPYLGNLLHDGMSAIARMSWTGAERLGLTIDLIAKTAFKQMFEALIANTTGEVDAVAYAYEQATLVEGQLRGFYKHVWPRLMAAYPNIILIEEELTFEHDGLVFMSRPDLVLSDREGNLWYIEYKSTRSKNQGWIGGWETAVQLHSTIKAIESKLGEKVTGVIVQGLYKGYESYGKQNSPFCYAYKRAGNPPFTLEQVEYAYKSGFRRYPVWELPGGVATWVDGMPDTILAEQFPQVPPIFIKEELVDRFFAQRNVREHEIRLALQIMETVDPESQQNLLDTCFPQHFDECNSYYGKPCAYKQICHGGVVDPLSSGYIYRTPHHALEVEQDEGGDQ